MVLGLRVCGWWRWLLCPGWGVWLGWLCVSGVCGLGWCGAGGLFCRGVLGWCVLGWGWAGFPGVWWCVGGACLAWVQPYFGVGINWGLGAGF